MDQELPTNNNRSGISSSLRNLLQNLSHGQKIVILIVLQVIFIIMIVSIVNSIISKPRDHVATLDDNGILKDIPRAELDLYEQELWKVIEATDNSLDKSIIKDAVVREGSYTEEKREIGDKGEISHQVSFIIDIDSIQQSYKVILGWSKNDLTTPIIDCLPVSEAKYPNSFCQGTYRNSNSLALYLPYQIESPYKAEYDFVGPDVYIDGDESTHVITVWLTPCNNREENKEKANEYIKTIPNYEEYQIEYIINSGIDTVCEENLQNGT